MTRVGESESRCHSLLPYPALNIPEDARVVKPLVAVIKARGIDKNDLVTYSGEWAVDDKMADDQFLRAGCKRVGDRHEVFPCYNVDELAGLVSRR
jgi:hypothetical protein